MAATPSRLRSPEGTPGGRYEEYHPYGSTAWWAGDTATVSQMRYRYTGMERDEETGLQCHGLRYYATWLGRWTSADPIGLGGWANLYAYGACNPVVRLDGSGLGCWDVVPSLGEVLRNSPAGLNALGAGVIEGGLDLPGNAVAVLDGVEAVPRTDPHLDDPQAPVARLNEGFHAAGEAAVAPNVWVRSTALGSAAEDQAARLLSSAGATIGDTPAATIAAVGHAGSQFLIGEFAHRGLLGAPRATATEVVVDTKLAAPVPLEPSELSGPFPLNAPAAERAVASTSAPKGATTRGAPALQKKLSGATGRAANSAFAGTPQTTEAAQRLVAGILVNPSAVSGAAKTVDVFNAAGQGVRLNVATGDFDTFLEAELRSR